ncbi:hypothetical protein BH10PLA2_BH10PLA2_22070 [soil metagenome]
MPILSTPSSAARTSLIYITTGALIDIWSGIWFAYLRRNSPVSDITWFLCYGLILTGLTLVVLGLAIGRIGRSARHAELPPQEVTNAVAEVDQTAAARAPIVAPINPAMPVGAAGTITQPNGVVGGGVVQPNGAVIASSPAPRQTPITR